MHVRCCDVIDITLHPQEFNDTQPKSPHCVITSIINIHTEGCLFLHRAYQVANNDLRASLHSEVEWCEFSCILHSGVNVSLHADQEKHTLNIRVLHSYVKEVAAFVVNLSRDTI